MPACRRGQCSDWFDGLVPQFQPPAGLSVCSASRRRQLDPFQNLRCRKVFVPPAGNVAEQFAKVESFFRESVSATPLIGRVGHFLDKPVLPQRPETRREDVRGDPLRRAEELVEVPLTAQQVTHDEQRPAVADEIQRTGHGTVRAARRPYLLPGFAVHRREFYLPYASRGNRILA